MDDLARLLSDLVAIPSVNPMGRALAGPEFLESRLTAYLEDWFRALGVRLERQPVAPDRDNLLAWYDRPVLAAASSSTFIKTRCRSAA